VHEDDAGKALPIRCGCKTLAILEIRIDAANNEFHERGFRYTRTSAPLVGHLDSLRKHPKDCKLTMN
jgi:hypothetical protein